MLWKNKMKNAEEILKSHKKFHITLGLERIQKILSLLGNPHKNYKVIHVAGTNGKGSTSKMINEILLASGAKVGLFTSPHLFSYTERLKVNNENITEYVFNRLVNDINNLALSNEIELSEFGLITAVAFYYFFVKRVEFVVLETGLGGLLDATNVVEDSISIITNIDFDHTERLGDTIEKISEQKAGIIKENSTVIINENNLGLKVIERVAKEKGAKIIITKNSKEECSLIGSFQEENAGLALEAAEVLKIDKEISKRALKQVTWHFRAEYFEDKKLLIDSSHNPSGIKALRQLLDEKFEGMKKTFYFGCLKNKDYKSMLNLLIKPQDELKFVEFNYPNSLKFDELDESYNAKKAGNIEEEILNNDNLKIFCGSIYMLGEIFKENKKLLGIYEEV